MNIMIRSSFILVLYLMLCKETRGLQCMASANREENINFHCTTIRNKSEFYATNISCVTDFPCTPNCSNEKLYWQLENSEEGVLQVFYKLPENDCNLWTTIELYTTEGLSEAKCKKMKNLSSTHSCRIFKSDVCSFERTCKGVVVVTFSYVYTGCYQFTATDKNVFPPQYIITNYKKINTAEHKPTFSFKYDDSSELGVKVTYPFIPSMSTLTLMKGIDFTLDYPCTDSGERHSKCVTCLDKKSVNCYRIHDQQNPEPKCDYTGYNGYSCIFPDMPPSNYCVFLEFQDDRCEIGTVFSPESQGCHWEISYVAEAQIRALSKAEESSPDLTPIWFCAVISGTLFLIIIFMLYKKRKTKPIAWLITHIPGGPSSLVEESPSVFLIYARDSEVFMDTIAQFRTVLSAMGCKVYDYWDEKRMNEVSTNPEGWVNDLMDRNEVRLVYIITPISQKYEESFKTPTSQVTYVNPKNFDGLFLYTFSILVKLNNIFRDSSYKRIFFVRLQSNIQESELTFLSPTTVYYLPTHLDKLIHFIKNKPFREFKDIPTVNSLPEVQTFFNLIEYLERNAAGNTDHIYKIVNTTQYMVKDI